MRFLCLFSPTLSAVLVTFLFVELILFHYDEHMFFHYRYCSNMKYSTLEASKLADLITVKIFSSFSILILITELCCHIVIYNKKTNIESRAQVYEIRGNQLVSQMRHHRNVVSILGHFLTFSIILSHYIIFASAFYIVPDTTLLLRIQCFLHFLDPCIIFFICPFIETMSSGTLRDNLFSGPQLW